MWILLLMIAVMPFERNPHLYLGDSVLGIFPHFTVIKLLGLMGLIWAAVRFAAGQVPLTALDSVQARAFLAFVAAVAFGGLASGAGIRPVTQLIAIIGLLPLVAAAVRSGRDVARVVEACALVMVAVFPYALRQMHRFGGRLGVGLHETNYFALVLALLLPLPLVLALEATGTRRALWLTAATVVVVQMILTGSRGGFLAMLMVLAFLVVRLARRPVLTLAGGAAILLVVLITVPNPMTRRLLASGWSEDMRDHAVESSNRQRLAVLQGGLRMVAAHPLTGVGLGNFKAELGNYGVERSNIAHNAYLELAAELGMPALIAFGIVVLATLRALERSARLALKAGAHPLRTLAIGLQAGLGGYLVGALFLSVQFERFFWLVMFLSISVEHVAWREWRAARRSGPEAA